MTMEFSPIEAQLLTRVQYDLPRVLRPFAVLGEELGVSESQVLSLIRDFSARGIIRELSGLFDARALGYHSVLVAAECAAERLDAAAAIINTHPGVSHNYARNATLNLWFTLALSPESRLGVAGTVHYLRDLTGARRMIALPTVRAFKLRVLFNLTARESETTDAKPRRTICRPAADEIRLIRLLQRPLPLIAEPYRAWGDQLGVSPAAMLDAVRHLYASGFLRRLAAVLHHRRVGYVANAMGVWNVPDASVGRVGELFATFPEVSHCYQRPRADGWPYNLYVMVHGHDAADCDRVLARLADAGGLTDWRALYSTKEYAKRRVRYFSDALPCWEAEQFRLAESA